MSFLLLGDIGGTNTRLSLEQIEDGHMIHQQVFTNSGKDLVSIVKGFLKEAAEKSQEVYPKIACFAVAGPIDKKKNSCSLTNLSWNLDSNDLSQRLEIERVVLINDFEAVGYGVLQLRETGTDKDFEILPLSKDLLPKDAPTPKDTPIGVIGAGTGLGEAFILKNKLEDVWVVYPTESGHIDFAARSILEFNLQEFIKKEYEISRVSVERVVSGPGIVAIYQFLIKDSSQDNKLDEVKLWENSGRPLSKAPSRKICEAAQGDEVCRRAMQMFMEAYSSEVGNFALRLLPYGGLWIAGGIAPDILQTQEDKDSFVKKLKNKGLMEKVIEKIPIYLVKNKQVGLIGAGYYAKRLLSQKNGISVVVK